MEFRICGTNDAGQVEQAGHALPDDCRADDPGRDLARTLAAVRTHSWRCVRLGHRLKRPVTKHWVTTTDADARWSAVNEVEREVPDPAPGHVRIRVQACGICHSDIHQARDEWGGSIYPMVPGHEIVGTVIARGRQFR